jgi:hypothetical protein
VSKDDERLWIGLTDRASAAATDLDTILRSLDLKRRQLHALVRPPPQAPSYRCVQTYTVGVLRSKARTMFLRN